jgi:hypothetical protein
MFLPTGRGKIQEKYSFYKSQEKVGNSLIAKKPQKFRKSEEKVKKKRVKQIITLYLRLLNSSVKFSVFACPKNIYVPHVNILNITVKGLS